MKVHAQLLSPAIEQPLELTISGTYNQVTGPKEAPNANKKTKMKIIPKSF